MAKIQIGQIKSELSIPKLYLPYIPQDIKTQEWAGTKSGATLSLNTINILRSKQNINTSNYFGFGKLYAKIFYTYDYISEGNFKTGIEVVALDYLNYSGVFEDIRYFKGDGTWVKIQLNTLGVADGNKVVIDFIINDARESKTLVVPLSRSVNSIIQNQCEFFFEDMYYHATVPAVHNNYKNCTRVAEADMANYAESANTADRAISADKLTSDPAIVDGKYSFKEEGLYATVVDYGNGIYETFLTYVPFDWWMKHMSVHSQMSYLNSDTGHYIKAQNSLEKGTGVYEGVYEKGKPNSPLTCTVVSHRKFSLLTTI